MSPQSLCALSPEEPRQINPTQHRTAKFEKSMLWRASKAWNSTRKDLRLIDDSSKLKSRER